MLGRGRCTWSIDIILVGSVTTAFVMRRCTPMIDIGGCGRLGVDRIVTRID